MLLGSFGAPWGALVPGGAPWGALGAFWGGCWGALGVPWGAFLDFDENWTSLSEQMGSKYAASQQSLASRNSSASSAELNQTNPARTYVLHAPGAKMTVVYTNSLKQGRQVFFPRRSLRSSSWLGSFAFKRCPRDELWKSTVENDL